MVQVFPIPLYISTRWWSSRFTLEMKAGTSRSSRSCSCPPLGPLGLWWMTSLASPSHWGVSHLRAVWLQNRWKAVWNLFGFRMPQQGAHPAENVGWRSRAVQLSGAVPKVVFHWRRKMRSSAIWQIQPQQLPGIKCFLSPLHKSDNWADR